jgi:glycine C-acetyltransferase
VAGRQVIIDWLRQRARPFLFSSAMTVPDVAACLEGVDMLEESEDLVKRLWANAEFMKHELKTMGFDIGRSTTPIIPVMLGEAPLAQQFSRQLFENRVFAMASGFPTVAKGAARIRVMNTAAHSQDDLEQALAAFESVGKALGVIQ